MLCRNMPAEQQADTRSIAALRHWRCAMVQRVAATPQQAQEIVTDNAHTPSTEKGDSNAYSRRVSPRECRCAPLARGDMSCKRHIITVARSGGCQDATLLPRREEMNAARRCCCCRPPYADTARPRAAQRRRSLPLLLRRYHACDTAAASTPHDTAAASTYAAVNVNVVDTYYATLLR